MGRIVISNARIGEQPRLEVRQIAKWAAAHPGVPGAPSHPRRLREAARMNFQGGSAEIDTFAWTQTKPCPPPHSSLRKRATEASDGQRSLRRRAGRVRARRGLTLFKVLENPPDHRRILDARDRSSRLTGRASSAASTSVPRVLR